jgi:hypothetical protein
VLGDYLEESDVARHAYDEVAHDLIQLATGAHSGTARVGQRSPE